MRTALWMILPALLLAGCDREDRAYRADPVTTQTEEKIALSPLSAGPGGPTEYRSGMGKDYEENAFHISQGQRFYVWFNCNGCHAMGGGDSGPPLIDGQWRYGGSAAQIVATLRQGRPNGMPSFEGRMTEEQLWQLAAYVRSMSGQLRTDVAPGRSDGFSGPLPESRRDDEKLQAEAPPKAR